MIVRLRSLPADRLHLWLMLALTFTTGINDAVGYLGLDRVFTGNMTGNVVILGMALTGETGLPVVGPALALGGYMAGAALGGRVLRRTTNAWPGLVTGLFATVAVLMLALGSYLVVVGESPEQWQMVAATTTAALAMGVQAVTARHVAVVDVTTVVVTSTLTSLAADSLLGNGRGTRAGRRFLAIAMIMAGAAAGALMLQVHLALGLFVAGVVILVVTLVGAVHSAADHQPAHLAP